MIKEWFRRRKMMSEAGSYLKATDVVSRPIAIVLTVLTFLIVGGLLYGAFLGGKWVFERFSNDDTPAVVQTQDTNTQEPGVQPAPSAQPAPETPQQSQPSAQTPPPASQPPAPTVPATGPVTIPDTGPGSGQ